MNYTGDKKVISKLELYKNLCNLVLTKQLSAELLSKNISTAKDMLLFVSCYKELGYVGYTGNIRLTSQVRKGLRYAFNNLNLETSEEIHLAALQPILKLVHPKPATSFHDSLFKNIAYGRYNA